MTLEEMHGLLVEETLLDYIGDFNGFKDYYKLDGVEVTYEMNGAIGTLYLNEPEDRKSIIGEYDYKKALMGRRDRREIFKVYDELVARYGLQDPNIPAQVPAEGVIEIQEAEEGPANEE